MGHLEITGEKEGFVRNLFLKHSVPEKMAFKSNFSTIRMDVVFLPKNFLRIPIYTEKYSFEPWYGSVCLFFFFMDLSYF